MKSAMRPTVALSFVAFVVSLQTAYSWSILIRSVRSAGLDLFAWDGVGSGTLLLLSAALWLLASSRLKGKLAFVVLVISLVDLLGLFVYLITFGIIAFTQVLLAVLSITASVTVIWLLFRRATDVRDRLPSSS